MGATSYGTALIGVSVPVSKLILQDDVRSCDHFQYSSGNFCATCGKPTWAQRRTYIPQLNIDEEDESTLGGLPICFNRWLNDGAEIGIVTVPECFVRVSETYHEANYEYQEIPLDLTQIKDQIKSVLEPLGLWDESDFGLWTVSQRY